LHAVFDIYTCYCVGCAEKNCGYLFNEGGHDEPWIAAAHAIEKADRFGCSDSDDEEDEHEDQGLRKYGILGPTLELLLREDAVVGIARAVQNGGRLPNEAELRRIGVDFSEFWENIKSNRESEAKSYIIALRKRQLDQANRCLRECWTVDAELCSEENDRED
jgi:hypothetical protein